MLKNKTVLILLVVLSTQVFSQINSKIINKTKFSIGETVEIKSDELNENRIINIYLPQNYDVNSSKTYPVIYLLDGSADEDFIHVSGLTQFAAFSWINIMPETIVVGIANVDRQRDFTYPSNNEEDQNDLPTSGKSEKFINFIEKELQPFVDEQYKSNSVKTIVGQSLGGLLTTEILFKKPELFDNYIIISPSLWWDDESLLKYELKNFPSEKSIYIAVGKEGKTMQRLAKELYDKIENSNVETEKLFFNFFEKQNHGDVMHLALYDSFEKLFKEDD